MISLNTLVKRLLTSYLIFLQLSVSSADGNGRIVGGHSTKIEKAPYLVQIKKGDNLLCGGTLVTRRHVVTAAHCLINAPQELLVVGGATKRDEAGIARSNVSAYIKHDAWNEDGYDMDIAVMKLETPLKNKLIKPIKYNCTHNWTVPQTVTLFGWGAIDEETKSVPLDLQTVKVKVIDKSECTSVFRMTRHLTDSMVCAGASNKDACSGDSGGPAIIKRQFCGVVSWGNGCGQEGIPGVYTSINVVKDFITEAIKKLK